MNARSTQQLLRSVTAKLTGKTRGPDHSPEGNWRTPRRDSYDVEDVRAKPWSRVGDGSVGQGLAYRDAMIQAAKEWYQQLWREYPLAEIRAARARHAALSAELDAFTAGGASPIGRPALVRRELGEVTGYLKAAENRLRRIDVTVLEALLHTLDFATGRLDQAIETIAGRAGCHRNSVIAALRRLRAHGFVAWVRRTVKTGNDSEFAPQREQTSNAYHFEHRSRMPKGLFQRYVQILTSKLKRLGKSPQQQPPAAPREVQDPEYRAALESYGASLLQSQSAST